jgi:hypothetical protein
LEYTVFGTMASGSEYCFPDPCFFRRVPVIFRYGNGRNAPESTRLPAGSRPYPEIGSFDLGSSVLFSQLFNRSFFSFIVTIVPSPSLFFSNFYQLASLSFFSNFYQFASVSFFSNFYQFASVSFFSNFYQLTSLSFFSIILSTRPFVRFTLSILVPFFCSSVTNIGVACFYLVLEKLPTIIIFFSSSQCQLFYIFYPKYAFNSCASLYLPFLLNFILQIYEISLKEYCHYGARSRNA